MQLTADLIYGFVSTLLQNRFDEPRAIPDCHKIWWELCCNDNHRFVAIAAPRGHAKSTAITKSYVLANLLFRHRDYCIIISDTFAQAVQFVQEIKNELTTNDLLIETFGIKGFNKDREDDIIVEFDDGVLFRVRGMGTEQKVRGLLWDSKRPNLIVGDDMENDEIVLNGDRREKARNWLFNAVLPTMSERGIFRMVGTILHMDSMLERFMPRDWQKETGHEELYTYTTKPIGGWMSMRFKAHNQDFSQILWPEKWDKKRLNEMQHVYISQGNPEGYYQEYLNQPIDPTNAYFKKDDFVEMSRADLERDKSQYTYYIGIDLAPSVKERRDFCAFVIGGMDENDLLHIQHVIRERMDSKEAIETMFMLQEQYKPAGMIMETGQVASSIGPFLRSEMIRRGVYINLLLERPATDKRTRAQSIRGRMRAGGVRFDKSKDWYSPFEQELLRFDRGAHDDQVDAIAWLGLMIDKMHTGRTIKEVEDDTWLEDNMRYLNQQQEQGRSTVTGY